MSSAAFQLMYFFTQDADTNQASRVTNGARTILGRHGISLRIWPPAAAPTSENVLPFNRPLDRWTEAWQPIMHIVKQERFVSVLNHWMPVIFCRYREDQSSAGSTLREPVNRLGPFVLINTRLTSETFGEVTLAHELGHAAGDLADIYELQHSANLMFWDHGQRTGTALAGWQVKRMIEGAYFRG